MNKSILFLNLLLLLAIGSAAFAGTNYVILGGDFQAAINASSNNDTIVVYPTVYTTNLIFDRPLTVVRSTVNTNALQLQGNIQIQGSGASSFSQCDFSGPVQVQFTGTVSFAQCKFFNTVTSQWANVLLSQVSSMNLFGANLSSGIGTNLQAYDSSLFGLSVSGGKVLLKRSSSGGGLTLSGNAALDTLRFTNTGPTSATATVGSNVSFVAVQSEFDFPLSLSGYKVWLGYNTFNRYSCQQTNCDSVLIGNKFLFNRDYSPTVAAIYVEGGTLKAYNNLIFLAAANGSGGHGMWLRSNVAEIVNNTTYIGAGSGNTLRGIYITDGGGPIIVRGQLTYCNAAGGYASGIEAFGSQTVNVSYCDLTGNLFPLVGISPPPANIINVDPFFVGGFGGDFSLSPGSPCINAGPPDAIYNDRDGSRNDMGYTGGPYWNPANYTNNNPMVFFLTGSPQTVFKGTRTNILVNAAAAAGH